LLENNECNLIQINRIYSVAEKAYIYIIDIVEPIMDRDKQI